MVGSEGHKGYGLSALIGILSGILTGLGFGHDPSGRHNDGCFMAVFDVEAFRPLQILKREVAEFAAGNRLRAGLLSGELEHLNAQRPRRDGIEVEETTLASLTQLAQEHGVAGRLGSRATVERRLMMSADRRR